jgi:hypothetical protein
MQTRHFRVWGKRRARSWPMCVQPRLDFESLISMRRRVGVISLGGAIIMSLAAVSTGCSSRQTLDADGPRQTSPVPTSSATSGISTQAPSRCRPDDVRMSVAKTASVMSQPFSDIALTNTGTTSCVLLGYPGIRVRGFRGEDRRAGTVPLAISLHHGLYERTDPGPRRVVLRPEHKVFFSIGTATAFQGGLHLITLTQLIAVLPGTNVPATLSIDLLASSPPGKRIPVGITAITGSPHP